MVQVSVIIVTYNTLAVTAQCIDSVCERTAGVDYEIIVVDNASSDGSRERFSQDGRIRYIWSDENMGFGRANNEGMKAARGKYLFLLNSDTILLNNAVRMLYDAAESYGPRLGVMGGILLDRSGRAVHSYGDLVTIGGSLAEPLSRFAARLLHKKADAPCAAAADAPLHVGYVTGADMFLPRGIFEQTGGFDPQFFMYAEDADWQKRIAAMGFDRVIVRGPEIVHLEGGSETASATSHWSYNRMYNAVRSRMIYIRKHYSRAAYAAFRVLFAIVRIPSFAIAPYTLRQKAELAKLVTKIKL